MRPALSLPLSSPPPPPLFSLSIARVARSQGDGILQGAKDFGYVALAMGGATAAGGAALSLLGDSLLGVWQAIGVLQLGRAVSLSYRYWGSAEGPLALPAEDRRAAGDDDGAASGGGGGSGRRRQ